jgi:hypothetical protein
MRDFPESDDPSRMPVPSARDRRDRERAQCAFRAEFRVRPARLSRRAARDRAARHKWRQLPGADADRRRHRSDFTTRSFACTGCASPGRLAQDSEPIVGAEILAGQETESNVLREAPVNSRQRIFIDWIHQLGSSLARQRPRDLARTLNEEALRRIERSALDRNDSDRPHLSWRFDGQDLQ